MPFPLSEITVAQVMRETGYSTALFGKWHIGDFKPIKGGNTKWPVSHPGLHVFDQWFAIERSTLTATLNCGCFTNSTCIVGHYVDRPPCTNYESTILLPTGINMLDTKTVVYSITSCMI